VKQPARFTTPLGAAALVLVLALGVATGCGGSSNAADDAEADPATDKLAQVLSRGTLVLSTDLEYPPQSMAVAGATRPRDTKCADNQLTADQVEGYDADTGKLIAEKLGVEACFVTPTWTEITGGNWGDRWDISYGSGSVNADRMQRLYMTQPYYAVPNVYFVASSSPAQHAGDLDGKRIGACSGCSHEAYLKGELEIPGVEITPSVKSPRIVTFAAEGPGLEAAAGGKIDAFLAAAPVGAEAIDAGTDARPLPEIAFTYYPSGFVDRSSGLSVAAFVASVDEIVQGLHADGTLKELSLKWFAEDYASAAAEYDVAALEQEVQ